jgi:hypothetical protein
LPEQAVLLGEVVLKISYMVEKHSNSKIFCSAQWGDYITAVCDSYWWRGYIIETFEKIEKSIPVLTTVWISNILHISHSTR